MHLDFTPEQRALRHRIRDYYRELFTPELPRALDAELHECGGPVYREVVRLMGRQGWLGIGWPTEYGGQGRGAIDQWLFLEEMAAENLPTRGLTFTSAGPTLMRVGTEHQKQEYLPRILTGEIEFAIGYTEPNAGSDLASLQT